MSPSRHAPRVRTPAARTHRHQPRTADRERPMPPDEDGSFATFEEFGFARCIGGEPIEYVTFSFVPRHGQPTDDDGLASVGFWRARR
jgi:hypothetical protein